MTITVVYTTQLKAVLGISSEKIEIDAPAHIGDMLGLLRDRYDAKFADMVFDADGELLPSVLLCLGDEQIDLADDAVLKEGDVVTLLSAISGG